MRSLFKGLIKKLLGERMRRALQENSATVVLVLGKKFRSVFRDEICDVLIRAGLKVKTNAPGYNFKLGLPLTVLGFDSGYQSIYKWVLLLLRPATLNADVFVLEFNPGDKTAEDLDFVKNIIRPNMIVLSDLECSQEESKSLNIILNAQNAQVTKILPKDLILPPEVNSVGNKLGRHYALAALAADLVLKQIKVGPNV